jgi:unsaturated rhamnogalacturonyl hydrolase
MLALCVPAMALADAPPPPTLPPATAATDPWSLRMADSMLARHPDAHLLDRKKNGDAPAWSYSTALGVYAIAQVGIHAGDAKLIQYAREYADGFLDASGKIDPDRYKPETFKLDDIAPGRLMLLLARDTHDQQYLNAAEELTAQFKEQPRTADGGFWHKKIYPHQMWLDGIFMACPFLAEAGATFHRPEYFDEAAKQILTIAAHTRDPKTGLFYHGWDESRSEKWADPKTSVSQNFWGRGDGWFAAGIVETLDNLPADHPQRAALIAVLQDLARAIAAVQDPETHVWWQVLDQGGKAGNYLESSASGMFVYALAKAAHKGYIDPHYLDVAKTGYEGVLHQFITTDPVTHIISLQDTCLVAGLGGKPYRDGTYVYYVHEPKGPNDPKGEGPFILASLELEHPSK